MDRDELERRSAPALAYLAGLRRAVPFAVILLLLLLGLFGAGVLALAALSALGLLLGWLAVLSWPRLTWAARGPRVAVVALLGFAAARHL